MTEAATIYDTGRDVAGKETETKRTKQPDLQTQMLRKHLGNTVTVYMINGIRLDGKLTGFDQYVISLDYKSMSYKSAISTIMPVRSKQRHEKERLS